MPSLLLTPSPSPPEWVRDAVFYQIFPDRFARSEKVRKPAGLQAWGSTPTYTGYQGGDLLGVAEHLDYLADLGINAIYFTPIFQSACNHRYHTHDYEKVDPMLGGDAALRTLIDETHARGMKVVLDGVFNHASRGFFQFNDILENGSSSAYLDWFTVTDYPLNAYDADKKPNYHAWWGLPALPKFNIKTPAVRDYLFSIAKRWVDFGIDGWRLDVANEIDDDAFWREFRSVVRSANPDCYIVGEVWHDSRHWLKGDMWDAVMNYLFTRACIAFFPQNHDLEVLKGTILAQPDPPGAGAFRVSIEKLLALYHPDVTAVQLNLLDSHDMARFISIASKDPTALKLATLFQMTYPGAPSVYYGDEIGMTGGHDPLNRGAFPWDKPDSWDQGMLAYFKDLIAIRKANPALRRGTFEFVEVPPNSEAVVAYLRKYDSDVALIVINTGLEHSAVTLDVAGKIEDGLRLVEHLGGREEITIKAGKIDTLRVGGRSGGIYLSMNR